MRTNRDQERKAVKAMGVAVSIFGIFFVIIWCVIVASMRAWFMLLFAIPIIGILGFRLALILRQDKKKDPWDIPDRRYPDFSSMHGAVEDVFRRAANGETTSHAPRFCHSCSHWIHDDFQFCPKCGRRIL